MNLKKHSLPSPKVAWTKKTGLWLAGNEGMEKKVDSSIIGYIENSLRIHSFKKRKTTALSKEDSLESHVQLEQGNSQKLQHAA